VAAPHHLAASAGLDILCRGGCAVDAMVAVNSTLGVVYPHMTGVGGDAFWLIHDAASGTQHVLNATGRAARAATPHRYGATHAVPGNTSTEFPVRGPAAAVTVPGAADGWRVAHERFGRLPFGECLAQAIYYATDGFPVAPGLARYIASASDLLALRAAQFLKPDGTPHAASQTMRLPALAETLEAIASGGRAAWEEIGARIAACPEVILTADDFAAHVSDWTDPVATAYRDWTVLTTPPNSQGFATLEILAMADQHDVAALADDPAGYVDLLARATMLAFADRDRYLTDPAFSEVPLDQLLDPDRLADLGRHLLDAAPFAAADAPATGGDTTFSCAVDAEGNVAAVIQSVYFEWGSAFVAGDTGILLQNRGSFFSLDPAHPNRLAPGKRTAHTLTATLLLDGGGRPSLVVGTMGGEGQPQTTAALVTRIIDHGLDPRAAVDAPRWLYGRTWGELHRGLRLERRFGPAVAEALTARGHAGVSLVDDYTDLMGHAQAISIASGALSPAADPRSDGAALGI
jgi:gamma-glutamyltranspeptidase/glutathione hydrolase